MVPAYQKSTTRHIHGSKGQKQTKILMIARHRDTGTILKIQIALYIRIRFCGNPSTVVIGRIVNIESYIINSLVIGRVKNPFYHGLQTLTEP